MIHFLAPWTLLLLLPVGGIIVLLYLLKLKRKELKISSTLLWDAAIADLQANTLIQKLTKNLLLFLQLAILLLLLTAAARPFRHVAGLSASRVVTIVDTSLSMRSTDIRPSRFDAAKSELLQLVKSMVPRESMLIISAGTKPKVVSSFTADKRALSKSIASLSPTDAGCDMKQALLLAVSLIPDKETKDTRIVILSDGGFGSLDGVSIGSAKLDYRCIGKSSDNVAITGIASGKSVSGERQIFVGLKNFAPAKKTFNLEFYSGDQLIDIREQMLEAGESGEEILTGTEALSGKIKARLDTADDLAADNVGYVYLEEPQKLSVLLVSKGNIFLQNAVNLDNRVQLDIANTVPAEYDNAAYDITIFDRISPPSKLPEGGYLLIGTSTSKGPAEEAGVVENPTVVDYERRHPVAMYVDFSSVHIAKAKLLHPKPWADSVVETTSGALCAAGTDSGRRFVQLSWDIMESDFPMRIGFPIFISNCINFLAGAGYTAEAFSIRTGQAALISTPTDLQKLNITAPDGKTYTVETSDSTAFFDHTFLSGVYSYAAGDFKGEFVANVVSEAESNINPVKEIKLGKSTQLIGKDKIFIHSEVYTCILFAALAVMLVEWYAYHRRL